jgi:hypothetical protein
MSHQQQATQHQKHQIASIGGTTPRPPLRRATYVHVSDLTSAYNIDHSKLEQELLRVNAEQQESRGKRQATSSVSGGGKTYASTLKSGPEEQISLTPEAVAAAADLDNELTAPVVAQKRLQPPRGGFNLCV